MGCSEEITSIVAMLQVQSIFTKPGGGAAAIKARVARRKFEALEGDLITFLNVMEVRDGHKMFQTLIIQTLDTEMNSAKRFYCAGLNSPVFYVES